MELEMSFLEYTKVPVKKLYCHWGQTRGAWRLSWVDTPEEKTRDGQQFCVHRVLFKGLYFTFKQVRQSIKACLRQVVEEGFWDNEEHLSVLEGYLQEFRDDVRKDETLS